MDKERYEKLKLGKRGAMLSIVAYICLSALKLEFHVYNVHVHVEPN